jgi:hypothetical protein
MNLFNIKNSRHQQILKEELQRIKVILREGSQYSTDEMWNNMTPEEKAFLLLSSDDNEGPEREAEYAAAEWDDIPADVQDVLDLSDFELAKYDQGGRTNLRAIDHFMKTIPNLGQLSGKFLAKVGRARVNDLTIKQATQLLLAIHKFVAGKNPEEKEWNPNSDSDSKRNWLGAEREAGRTSGLD